MTEEQRVRAAQMLRSAQENLMSPEYKERIKLFSTDAFTEAQALQLIIHGVKI